jgi:hypothetical protein
MRDYRREELDQAVERYRASLAVSQDTAWVGARIEYKGLTLLVVRGERSELKARVR